MKKCISCGKEIENDSDFCFYCGTAQNSKSNEKTKLDEPLFKDESEQDLSVGQIGKNAIVSEKKSKKKIILIVSIVVVVAILAIVSVNVITNSLDHKESEIPTINDNSFTIETMSNSETIDDGRTYFSDYSIVLPDDWTYEKQNDTIRFCSKYKYEQGFDGLIFCIEKTKQTESDYMGAVKLLGDKDGYNFFVVYPMGMGLTPDDTVNQKHAAALGEQDDVINSFRFITDSEKSEDNNSNEVIPSVTEIITEESELYGGLRFSLSRADLDKRQHDAITKLGIDNRQQYEWNRTNLETEDYYYVMHNDSKQSISACFLMNCV